VVVAVFENLTGEESLEVLGRIAADWLTQGISRLEIVEAVPNMVVRELLPALKSGKKGPQSMDYLQTLAKDVDARTMITGSYYLSGENLCFQANITDMEQEKLLFSLEPIIGPKKSPINVIDILKQKVMVTLINHFDPGYIAPLLGDKTPTFAAYKEYMAGLELWDIDYPRAITHFKRAIELDPDFHVAKLSIAVAYANLDEYARMDTILRQLYEKRDQLSDFERYLLEWFRAKLAGNREKGLRMLRKAGDIAKKGQVVWSQIGVELLCLNRPRETIDVYEQFDENYWRFFIHNSLRINIHASAYHMLGDFQKELELARKWQKLFPERLYLFSIEVRALAALNKINEMKKVIDKSLMVSTSSGTPGDVMREAALELRAHGHMKAYREIVTRAFDWYKNRPPGEAATENHRYKLAVILYIGEQWDESERIFKDLSREKPDKIDYKGSLGVLAARKGNLKEARKISDELKKMSRPYLFGRHAYWRARIASLLGEKQRAVELLRESFAQGNWYGTYLLQEIDFEPIKDYPPFKELMRPKG
jgi:tetratricopeptide (TPR) repeat protein